MSTLLALMLWSLPMAGHAKSARPAPAPAAGVRVTIPAADVLARCQRRDLALVEYLVLDESTDDLEEEDAGDIEDTAAGFKVPLAQTLFRNGIAVEPTQHLRLDPPPPRPTFLRC